MKLYLIRHAQSENNARWARTHSRGGYAPDPLLSDIGHRQAEILAHYIAQDAGVEPGPNRDPFDRRGFQITHLYTSLMQRAIQTAEYLSQALALPLYGRMDNHERGGITKDDEVGEDAQGLPGPGRAFFKDHYPELILPDSVSDDGWWNRPPETREQAILRAGQLLEDLTSKHADSEDRIAMVTHGGFISTFLKELFGATKPDLYAGLLYGAWFGAANASITKVEFEPDLVLITYHNRVDFLPTELLT